MKPVRSAFTITGAASSKLLPRAALNDAAVMPASRVPAGAGKTAKAVVFLLGQPTLDWNAGLRPQTIFIAWA